MLKNNNTYLIVYKNIAQIYNKIDNSFKIDKLILINVSSIYLFENYLLFNKKYVISSNYQKLHFIQFVKDKKFFYFFDNNKGN
jgi:hypothetical protein